ncbi:MAG: hypothetical protein A2171_00030 [Candidatus Levybacteria bacterium RBG_13_35_9]|nr:MAG: hypothetical protein A2171_00030 [Candidatus Levybacteria bacterium RBG_13_35_9]
MSGHSKWSTIKRQKGAADAKRGATFTKLSNAITIAVKQGGGIGDPDQNFRLRLAVDAARASNMPKANIQRAIERATEGKSGDLEEVIYEGFAPGGVSVIVEAATDNPMRTTAEVKSIFNKSGASFGQPGSVSYQFKQVGRIIVEKNGKSLDDIYAIALDAQAEDIEDAKEEVFIFTKVSDLTKVKDFLYSSGLVITDAEIIRKPVITNSTTDANQISKIENFISSLENLDDVQKVYTNLA